MCVCVCVRVGGACGGACVRACACADVHESVQVAAVAYAFYGWYSEYKITLI